MGILFTNKKRQSNKKYTAVEVVISNVFHDFNIG